jgi:hypothetical protein
MSQRKMADLLKLGLLKGGRRRIVATSCNEHEIRAAEAYVEWAAPERYPDAAAADRRGRRRWSQPEPERSPAGSVVCAVGTPSVTTAGSSTNDLAEQCGGGLASQLVLLRRQIEHGISGPPIRRSPGGP